MTIGGNATGIDNSPATSGETAPRADPLIDRPICAGGASGNALRSAGAAEENYGREYRSSGRNATRGGKFARRRGTRSATRGSRKKQGENGGGEGESGREKERSSRRAATSSARSSSRPGSRKEFMKGKSFPSADRRRLLAARCAGGFLNVAIFYEETL